MEITDRIQTLMNEKSMTAAQLTRDVPLTNGLITQWKQGKQKPSLDAVVKIARYFNVSLDWLLIGEGEMRPTTEPKTAPELSETEEIILETYRNADKETRLEILKKVLDISQSG